MLSWKQLMELLAAAEADYDAACAAGVSATDARDAAHKRIVELSEEAHAAYWRERVAQRNDRAMCGT